MILNTKVILSSIAIILVFVCYLPYISDIFRNKTKPHVYSWLLWSILCGTSFFIQIQNGAGVGSWTNFLTSLFCLLIFMLALKKGEKVITKFDTVCFLIALLALCAWLFYKNSELAIILVVISDMLAFTITIIKSYHKPYDETNIAYFIAGVKWVFALLAIEKFTLTTALFPIYLIIFNFGFVIMVIIRRTQIKNQDSIR